MLSKTKQSGIRLTYQAFPSLGSAELENPLQNWMLPELQSKTLAMQMKSSGYAEEDEHSAYADLRSRVETSQASKKEMLTSIREDIRAVSRNTEFLRFLLAMTHTEIQYDRI